MFSTKDNYAPIAIFVYARPDHTRRMLAALSSNELAKESDLIVYSDAARNEFDISKVNQVRSIISEIKGFRLVKCVHREKNFGLARNIIDGVSSTCAEYGRVIVVEDDIVTSPYFLTYMNDALVTYSDEDRVYCISGCNYPADLSDLDAGSYFMRLPLCWGWATWIDKWSIFEKTLSDVSTIDRDLVSYINFSDTHDYFKQAKLNVSGQLNTWFIFWYIAIARREGLTLFPKQTLVVNVGHDGSGENSAKTSNYNQIASPKRIDVYPIPIQENKYAVTQHKLYFRSIRQSLVKRIGKKFVKMARSIFWR